HRVRGGDRDPHRRAPRRRAIRHGTGGPRLTAEPPPAAVGPDQDELRRAARAGPPGPRPGEHRPGTGPVGPARTGAPRAYLHAVATPDGLRLDEHLSELAERPPMDRILAEVPAYPAGM